MGTFVPANIIRVIRIKQSRTTGVYKSAIPPKSDIFKLKHLNNVGINTSLCPLSPNRHRSFSKESALSEKRHIGLKERNNIL